jgi:hypothetical protein
LCEYLGEHERRKERFQKMTEARFNSLKWKFAWDSKITQEKQDVRMSDRKEKHAVIQNLSDGRTWIGFNPVSSALGDERIIASGQNTWWNRLMESLHEMIHEVDQWFMSSLSDFVGH